MPSKRFRTATLIALAAATWLAVPAAAAPRTCDNGYVALTYDDGPAATTTALLAALRDTGMRATFFTLGANARAHPELMRQTRRAGMWIGNHSWSHPHLPELSRGEVFSELVRTQVVTALVSGGLPTLFRPPYGETNAEIAATAKRLGMTQVLWTVDTRDWAGVDAAAIRAAAATAEPGGIILMHDLPSTVEAVPLIAADLAERGLCAGRIAVRGGTPVAVAP